MTLPNKAVRKLLGTFWQLYTFCRFEDLSLHSEKFLPTTEILEQLLVFSSLHFLKIYQDSLDVK